MVGNNVGTLPVHHIESAMVWSDRLMSCAKLTRMAFTHVPSLCLSVVLCGDPQPKVHAGEEKAAV